MRKKLKGVYGNLWDLIIEMALENAKLVGRYSAQVREIDTLRTFRSRVTP